jgi:endonuclease III related protein
MGVATFPYSRPEIGAPKRRLRARQQLVEFFRTLADAWGAQQWWPAETPFEVIVGAYLTQNTSWTNVGRALHNLRVANRLSLEGIRQVSIRELEALIRPAGYFRQKAHRIKLFVEFLDRNFSGSLEQMFTTPTPELRSMLLALHGVGPETADSILLYGGNHPVFVVDAYTRRVLFRHRLIQPDADYEEIRLLVETALGGVSPDDVILRSASPPITLDGFTRGAAHDPSAVSSTERPTQVQVLNEMHALIVGVGKEFCRKSSARCEGCPLHPLLEGSPRRETTRKVPHLSRR